MAEFKKLSDVEVVETPMDTANVLIEEDGVIKKAPKSAVGTVKSVNGAIPDENGNVTIETAASWNDLKDKPFGEGELTVVVPETTVTVTSEGVIIGEYTDLIKAGSTCIVTFNGTDYECVAVNLQGAVTIGNIGILGMEGGSNEPFIIGTRADFGILLYCAEEVEATISIKAKPIIQIDEKFIPTLTAEYSYPVFDLQSIILNECNASLNQYDNHNGENLVETFPMSKETWAKIYNMFGMAQERLAYIVIREYGMTDTAELIGDAAVRFIIKYITFASGTMTCSKAVVELSYNETDGICTETIVTAECGYTNFTMP